MAQFLSRDPAVSVTRSPYGYVNGNPLNVTDPSGLCGWAPWDWGDCHDVRGGVAALPHLAVDVVSDFGFFTYWGAYSAASGINEVGGHFGPIGSAVSHVLALPLTIPEAAGLGGDAALDWVKALFVPGYLGVGDEGTTNRGPDCKGPYLLGSQVGPLLRQWFGWDWRAPGGHFPGIDLNGHVDFEW